MKSKSKENLNYFTRLLLEKKGTRDARLKIICRESSESEWLSSPFFRQEISLCLAKIHEEREEFLEVRKIFLQQRTLDENKKNDLKLNIKTLEEQKKSDEIVLNNLKQISVEDDFCNDETSEFRMLLGEDKLNFNEDVIKEFRMIEKRAPIEVEKARLQKEREKLTDSILTYPNRIKVFQEQIEMLGAVESQKEVELQGQLDIVIARCKQYYSLTIARLSAYWSGVLRGSSDKNGLSAQFQTKKIFDELQQEIENLENLRKEWK